MSMQAIDSIVDKYDAQASNLLAILMDIQQENKYLPRPALEHVADRLEIPVARIFNMATFYKAFSLEKRGDHICTVCMGTACHVRGAPRVLEELERAMNIKDGETTEDGTFTIESVNCVGACALGPLVIMDGDYHGNMTPTSVKKMLKKLQK